MSEHESLTMVERLVARATRLGNTNERTILGITGCPGAGKSSLAERLVRELNEASVPSVYVPMDGFHLADVSLERLGSRLRKGAIDTFDGNGYLALLRRLRRERHNTVFAPGFSRTIEQPIAASIAVDPADEFVVTEGNYLLADEGPWAQVRAELTEAWFCDLDAATRYERLVARHVRFGKIDSEAREWVKRVDEHNARLVERTRHKADLIIDMQQLTL